MAVYHCHTHPISRAGKSGSAIACAAYRSGEALAQTNTKKPLSAAQLAAYRTGEAVADGSGKVHDYTRKGGVAHTEIMVPEGVDAAWTQDRAALWNQAEAADTRKNSRVAREWRIALPHELDHDQRVALTREFSGAMVELYGVAADVAVHAPSRSGDQRNWHAHVLCTTREITNEGFTRKAKIEWSNTNLAKEGWPYSSMQIREVRLLWQEIANEHLAQAGHEVRIDHRSLAEQGIALDPARTVHVGQIHAEARDAEIGTERILPVDRLDSVQSANNAAVIEADPSFIIDRVVSRESAFSRRNVASVLHRYVNEDWEQFDRTLDRIMADPSLVRLMEGGKTSDTGIEVESVWSTKAAAMREAVMLDRRDRLAGSDTGALSQGSVDRGIRAGERNGIVLSDEQRAAVETIARPGQIAMLRGVAGTGKTTALTAVREAVEADGSRIVGGALAGKAARELADGSGIEARTLASWERSWDAGFDRLGKGDVFVMDEAGMVGAAQMDRIMARVEEAGAKIVLTGDERQLQPIEAGAAFRTMKNRAGNREGIAELTEVRRQGEEWQRTASKTFGEGEAGKALDAYNARGDVRLHNSVEQTRDAIVTDYFARLDEAREQSPDGVRGTDHIVTAYRNVDVDGMNAAIRDERVRRGEIGDGIAFRTDEGERQFSEGDRVLLTRNDRNLGVANGDRAEVVRAEKDRLDVRLGDGREVRLDAETYDGVRSGYAVTTHKAQGMTVDRVHVMAGQGMDSSLAYVAMTRQRDGATLHAAREHFRNYDALRNSIGHQRMAASVGDYLPERNAVEAVRERIAETDAARGNAPQAMEQDAAQGAEDRSEAATQDVRAAMRDAWRTAADRMAGDGEAVDRTATQDEAVREPVAGQEAPVATTGREGVAEAGEAETGNEARDAGPDGREARTTPETEQAAGPDVQARSRAGGHEATNEGNGPERSAGDAGAEVREATGNATPIQDRAAGDAPSGRPAVEAQSTEPVDTHDRSRDHARRAEPATGQAETPVPERARAETVAQGSGWPEERTADRERGTQARSGAGAAVPRRESDGDQDRSPAGPQGESRQAPQEQGTERSREGNAGQDVRASQAPAAEPPVRARTGPEQAAPEPAARPSRLARLKSFIRGGNRTAGPVERSDSQEAPEPAGRTERTEVPRERTADPAAKRPVQGRDRPVTREDRSNTNGRPQTRGATRDHTSGSKSDHRDVQRPANGRPAQPPVAERKKPELENVDRRESLKQRLQQHAAGGRTQDAGSGGDRDRLRQKLVDHAAGKTTGKAMSGDRGKTKDRAKGAGDGKDRGRDRGQENGR